ncbi:MAG: hypothetical protein E6Q36_02705 [Chryseobacterium sp.]|nr:MAG: hypothetical protein E6Q36_02705 [Chryseobacterium sp.]
METVVRERIREEIQTIRKGVIVFSDTDEGQVEKLAYQMKLALNRIEFEICGVNPMRKVYDLRSKEIVIHEVDENSILKPSTSKSSIVTFYCQKGLECYFKIEAIVPFTEDDEMYFSKCEQPAKRLMQHLGETKNVDVSVWVGDHSQIVWSSRW